MSVILGLDIGPNSIGWALIDDDRNRYIDMGVRIFEEGVSDLDTGTEQSKNATRTEKRQIRKMITRRKRRKENLMKRLFEYNLRTAEDSEFLAINPYEARARAVNEKISLNEFARALYHIGQRRGFLSNRKTDDDKETGAIFKGGAAGTTGISELQEAIEKNNFHTLGEYLYSLNPNEKRIRNRYTLRKMYVDEFNIIWEKQQEFYSDILTDELKIKFRDEIIFKQRPLKSQKHTVGFCKFEKDKHRAPMSSFEYQEFRMLQQVNNLSIRGGNRIDLEQQALSFDERKKMIKFLSENAKLDLKTTKKIKTVLNLESKVRYDVNLQHQGKIDGLKTLTSFKKVLGSKFGNYSKDELQNMLHTLFFAEDSDWLIIHAQKKWKLTEEEAKAYAKIKVEQGYGSVSVKAIRKMLPYLREGLLYNEAAEKVGYDHSLYEEKVSQMERLPEPPTIANPIVKMALFEIRKVVNAIIDKYGNPETIRIELARELKIPKLKREEIRKSNFKIQKKNEEIKEILKKDFEISRPSRDDLLKYRLWEECKRTCPYTGKSIELNQIFGDYVEFEIEHIIPYSRSLDNSYMNKSLCWKAENQDKGNKTPYEFYSPYREKYTGVKERVKDFPAGKARRFLQEEVDKDFISRQLNDTRYIAREAMKFLQHLTPDVSVGNGKVTSYLRKLWGLNNIYDNIFLENDIAPKGEKSRKDHRHHAIDAVVVACTTRGILQKLSTEHGILKEEHNDTPYDDRNHDFSLRIKIDAPWKNIREDTKKFTNRIIISHKCNKKVTGALHEETFYGKLYDELGQEKLNEKGKPLFTVRKPIVNMTGGEILNIADPTIKDIVLDRIYSKGGSLDAKGKLKKIPNDAFNEPMYLTSPNKGKPNQIKKARVLKPFSNSIQIRDYNIWAEPGNNHHSVIYTDEDGKVFEKMVTLFEAAKRKTNGLSAIDTELENNQEFFISLQRNEMFIKDVDNDFDFEDKSIYTTIFDKVFRLQKMSKKDYSMRNHSISILESENKDNKKYLPGLDRIQTVSKITLYKKIIIDPIGFIRFADE